MNKHQRYINILSIKIFDISFSLGIGNPMWFVEEFKNLKENTDVK